MIGWNDRWYGIPKWMVLMLLVAAIILMIVLVNQ